MLFFAFDSDKSNEVGECDSASAVALSSDNINKEVSDTEEGNEGGVEGAKPAFFHSEGVAGYPSRLALVCPEGEYGVVYYMQNGLYPAYFLKRINSLLELEASFGLGVEVVFILGTRDYDLNTLVKFINWLGRFENVRVSVYSNHYIPSFHCPYVLYSTNLYEGVLVEIPVGSPFRGFDKVKKSASDLLRKKFIDLTKYNVKPASVSMLGFDNTSFKGTEFDSEALEIEKYLEKR